MHVAKMLNSKTLYRTSPDAPLPTAVKRIAPAVGILMAVSQFTWRVIGFCRDTLDQRWQTPPQIRVTSTLNRV